MARGQAKNLETRIMEIDGRIEGYQAKINDLKVQRKELEIAKQAELLFKVEEAAKSKGISVDELLAAVIK